MQKSPDAFRTISEVAEDLDVPQHVLRFWETRFSSIRPLKRGGGRRYYRPDDVDLLKGIRQLLYGQGYTIKGVQRILREDGLRFVQALGRGEQGMTPSPPASDDEDDGEAEAAPALSAVPADESDTDGRAGTDATFAELMRDGLPAGLIPDAGTPSGPGVAGDDLARLRRVLDELLECERILGTLGVE